MTLAVYVPYATTNPYGWRPWESRFQLGYLGAAYIPNYSTFARDRKWLVRDAPDAPIPRVYVPPELSSSRARVTMYGLSGMFDVLNKQLLQKIAASGGFQQDVASGTFTEFPSDVRPPKTPDEAGAVSYRVDPRSGVYQLYKTDILPRGTFAQNSFQPPAPPAVTPLGQETQASGEITVKLPDGRIVKVSSSAPSEWQQYLTQAQAWLARESFKGIANWMIVGAGLLGLFALRGRR